MILRPYWIVLALTIYLPFEDFLLKWLPVSESIYFMARLSSELLIYALFAFVVCYNIAYSYSWRKTPIDVLLLIFVFLAILSIIKNHGSILSGLVGIRTLLRYVFMYYIVININITHKHAKTLIIVMLSIAIGESLLGVFQHFAGLSNFWYPRLTTLEAAGITKGNIASRGGIELGSSMGTFCHPVSMSLYLLIGSILTLSFIFIPLRYSIFKKIMFFCLFVLGIIGLLFTYSKGSLLAALLAFPVVLVLFKRKRLILNYASFGMLSLILLAPILLYLHTGAQTGFVKTKETYVDPLSQLEMMFSQEYLQRSENTRQWVLKEVGGVIMRTGTLIGFSPDETTARLKIVQASGGALQKLITYAGFEDVFWVALFAYYGYLGLGLFFWILYRVFKCSLWVMKHSESTLYVVIANSVATLIIVTIPVTFLVRTFEFRTFAFYFWLLIGLTVSEYMRLNSVQKTQLSHDPASQQ